MLEHIEKHREQYVTDAYFRQAVDMIVPLILDALAIRAERDAGSRDAELTRIMNESPLSRWPNG